MAISRTQPVPEGGGSGGPARRKRRAGRPKRRARAEKITEKGRPVVATTTAPAPAAQDAAASLTDDAGVFSTGPAYAPEYHYHRDTQNYPAQVNAQLAEAGAEAAVG